jgi:hypothetical protein
MKKFLLPRLAPVALLLILCALTYLSEKFGDVRMINGSPDNEPLMAIASPVVYMVLGMLNALAWLVDCLPVGRPWAGTLILGGVMGTVLSFVFYAPSVDSCPLVPVAMAFCVTYAVFIPMAFML